MSSREHTIIRRCLEHARTDPKVFPQGQGENDNINEEIQALLNKLELWTCFYLGIKAT